MDPSRLLLRLRTLLENKLLTAIFCFKFMSCLLSRESAEEGVSKEDRKNVKNVHYTVKGVFLQDSRKFIFSFLPFFPLRTPFYSQHARLR